MGPAAAATADTTEIRFSGPFSHASGDQFTEPGKCAGAAIFSRSPHAGAVHNRDWHYPQAVSCRARASPGPGRSLAHGDRRGHPPGSSPGRPEVHERYIFPLTWEYLTRGTGRTAWTAGSGREGGHTRAGPRRRHPSCDRADGAPTGGCPARDALGGPGAVRHIRRSVEGIIPAGRVVRPLRGDGRCRC